MDNGLIEIQLGQHAIGKIVIIYLIVFSGIHQRERSMCGNILTQLSQKENKV
jgi:hypothetical protein